LYLKRSLLRSGIIKISIHDPGLFNLMDCLAAGCPS
jgi:hypothetical protein